MSEELSRLRHPSRTELVDSRERQVRRLANKATDLLTVARHYADIAEHVRWTRQGSELACDANDDVVGYALKKAQWCRDQAKTAQDQSVILANQDVK